ncbi:MAG TPA: hypothetical protein VGQ54_13905 [Burkholderiales bacterium]|jgi:hypothetical protein|nr:hypothetical protein [Burkholderiales bacterium]
MPGSSIKVSKKLEMINVCGEKLGIPKSGTRAFVRKAEHFIGARAAVQIRRYNFGIAREGRDFTAIFLGESQVSFPGADTGLIGGESDQEGKMAFYAFYVIAIVILILHFTGWLKRNNLEWLILLLAVAVFPVVIFLR